MSATLKMKTGVTAVWGTSAAGDAGYGKVISARKRHTGEMEKLPDEDGETCGIVLFDESDELELVVMCKSTMTEPTRGNSIVISGVTGIILDFEINWEQKSVKKMSLNATKWTATLA